MKRMFCLIALAGLLVGLLAGCDEPPPKTTTVEFPQATSTVECQGVEDGIRIKFITAEGTHEQKQVEVQRQLEEFINSGQYEIVRVTTTRCNGSEAHLLSAEVYYRPKK